MADKALLQDKSEFIRFGVIVGPSGSGKTSAVRELCNKYPEGGLYHEVGEPDTFVR